MSNLPTIMDYLFDGFPQNALRNFYTPNALVNVSEHSDNFQISLQVPGIDPKDIKLEITDNVLNISYKKEEVDKKEFDYLRQEYASFASFNRSIQFPKNIDTSSIKAVSKHGILLITINKSPEKQPKTIEIEVH